MRPVSKRRLTLRVRIPPYRHPRNAWRCQIHMAALRNARAAGVSYRPNDRLEVAVRLYLEGTGLEINDVDNRLKDILDALQGRAGGPKNRRGLEPIIPNDHQVFRVVIEKALPPKQSGGFGHLKVSRFSV